jgi:hypothetical protein
LLGAAAALAVGGVVSIVLGLDAAAEMPVSADRISVLLGTGLGGLALLLTAAGLVAVEGLSRVQRMRAAMRQELFSLMASPPPAARRRRRAQ